MFLYSGAWLISSISLLLTLCTVVTASAAGQDLTSSPKLDNGKQGVLVGHIILRPASPIEGGGGFTRKMEASRIGLRLNNSANNDVINIISDDKGYFKINLLAGTYSINLTERKSYMSKNLPVTVQVVADKEVKVDILLDASIR